MLRFIWRLIPANYKWRVAIKKTAYAIAKVATACISTVKVKAFLLSIGVDIDAKAFQEGLGLALVGLFEWIHDWARVKFPHVKWL